MTDLSHQALLMVTGTLDTTDIGGSPYSELPSVSQAFPEAMASPDATPAPVSEEPAEKPTPQTEPTASKASPRKRATTKKEQAPAPAES
ncbi:hypothetical protein ACWGQT_00480 [Streptomyces yangpuensis]